MTSDTTAPPDLGNYEIVSKIAEGGMGTVYKARHRHTGEIVAVKVIAPTTAKNPILLQRFEREFLAAKVLDHPNVVRALEYCGSGPHPFLVMEFVDGESFGQRIERAGAFPEAEAVRLIAQVCEGLQRAHKQGLVHRDVKPDNILITQEGVAKLTDMGLVKDVEGDLNLTKTGRGLGTPHYMAPEQFRNAKSVDVRGDIYSLGATLYAMVTGVVPFENASPLDCWMRKIRNEFSSPKELVPTLSDRVDWAIRRAMSAEPDRRPTSCREFLEDLTGQSRTVPARMGRPAATAATPDLWYMVYKDETGMTHTVKGSTDGIRNALQNHLLGDAATILVSRTKTGQFQSLASVAEFRDLVVKPAPLPTSNGQRSSGVVKKPSGVAARAPTERRPEADTDEVAVAIVTAEAAAIPQRLSGRAANPAPRTPSSLEAKETPPTTSPSKRTPTAVPIPQTPSPFESPTFDSQAPTALYLPAATDFIPTAEEIDDSPTGDESALNLDGIKPHIAIEPRKPINWTPLLLVVVMILSAIIFFLILDR